MTPAEIAARTVAELRAWAERGEVYQRGTRPVAAPWYGPKGRASADRGRARSAMTHRAGGAR